MPTGNEIKNCCPTNEFMRLDAAAERSQTRKESANVRFRDGKLSRSSMLPL